MQREGKNIFCTQLDESFMKQFCIMQGCTKNLKASGLENGGDKCLFSWVVDAEVLGRRPSSVPGDTKWRDWHVNPSTMYFAHQIFKPRQLLDENVFEF